MTLEAQYRLETPENIEVEFELAGPGSRFCAVMIDWLIIVLIIVLLSGLASLAGVGVGAALSDPLSDDFEGWMSWVNALLLLVLMCVMFGYFFFFEYLMAGQTPGKRSMRIRAIRDDGTPMTPMEILVRNLIRIADFLPAFYGLGGLVAMLHPLHKRLGDLAAGTIVVKEAALDYRARSDKKYELPEGEVTTMNPELTPEEGRLVRGFLQRRTELLPEARRRLAARLAAPLYHKYGGHYVGDENYLERLAEGRQHVA